MKHPIGKYNQQQTKIIEQLPEEERPWHERMFGIGNVSYCYHHQANPKIDGHPSEPTEEDFAEWLEGLVVKVF